MHFVASASEGPRMLAEFVATSGMRIFDLCQPREIQTAATLMQKFATVPMDFADATLVLLADALSVRDVLTLDRRGFRVFRDLRRRPFRLVLDK
jgi:hypothetical protein